MKAIKEDLENTFQRRILEFLKDHHHVTVRSIAEHVMAAQALREDKAHK
jgi:hypothetical protein